LNPPAYVTSVEELLWGGTLVANTMAMHGFGMVSRMIAVAGLLTFAWSTGVLLTLAQEFQDHQLLQLKKRRGKQQPHPNSKHGEQAAGGQSS
jgi:hypothetical protein